MGATNIHRTGRERRKDKKAQFPPQNFSSLCCHFSVFHLSWKQTPARAQPGWQRPESGRTAATSPSGMWVTTTMTVHLPQPSKHREVVWCRQSQERVFKKMQYVHEVWKVILSRSCLQVQGGSCIAVSWEASGRCRNRQEVQISP